MSFAEELFSLWKGMMMAIAGVLIIFVAYITETLISFVFNLPIWIDVSIIVPLFVGYCFFIREFWKLSRRVLRWNENFRKFSYIFRFETSPLKGKTPTEKILNQLLGAIGEAGQWLDKFLKVRKRIGTFLNVKVSGKKNEHFFDVYISEELLKDDKSKVTQETRSKLRKHGSIFIKRYDKKGPIDKKDLEKLREEILDVIAKTKSRINTITVVSTSGFTKSAIAYAKDEKNWVKKCPFDLIQEMPDGYTVIQVG